MDFLVDAQNQANGNNGCWPKVCYDCSSYCDHCWSKICNPRLDPW